MAFPSVRSIRVRLVASYVGLTLLTVGLMSALALTLVERIASQREATAQRTRASSIARQLAPMMIIAPPAAPDQPSLAEAAEVAALLGDARVRVLDRRHEPIADSGPAPALDRLGQVRLSIVTTLQKPPEGAEMVAGKLIARGSVDGASPARPAEDVLRSTRVFTVPVTPAGGGEPVGYVELSDGPDAVSGALATTRNALAVAGGIATASALVAGLLVGRSLSAPLLGLARAAERMGAGDLATRADASGSTETALLAREFNRMAERLESSFAQLAAERDALRRFIGDASHELRTPITALKTFNELLADGAGDDRATRDEFLAESGRQLARLERVTHELLDLSRLDAGVATLDVREEPVVELLEETAGAYKRLAAERNVRLSLVAGPELTVRCDRRRIESALSNLVENALKHTPEGGAVEMGAHNGHGAITIWVRDTGSGIEAEDAPYVFERFYRGRNAASGDGAGLGLAIVRSVAQAHGGGAAVETALGQGSRFTLTLPASPN